MAAFVPDGFEIPAPLVTDRFQLDPLQRRHNERDLQAWTSSVEHIRATPGFAGRDWPPDSMSAEDNGRDLHRHDVDFQERRGFTYAVLSGGSYVGCLYLYPAKDDEHDGDARSWVTSERADLDQPWYEAVSRWLAESWPWKAPEYAPR